ncbi:putative DNA mismatch repair protein msh6 [Rosellinia necatrix]|uniref:Putative DNA mismatch repair protein msh6 n=1 Tax=Rosellinia necatrix TaxID=77044 RepID=A0A1S8A608_ROSNE|nr:putative DNA mismatch repair protein msh6 [Rosellinia necatrix]
MGETRTPAKTPSMSRKTGLAASGSSSTATRKQQTILGFFAKSSPNGPSKSPSITTTPAAATPTAATASSRSSCLQETTRSNSLQLKKAKKSPNVTPVPSSDALEPSSSQENHESASITPGNKVRCLVPPPRFVVACCIC